MVLGDFWKILQLLAGFVIPTYMVDGMRNLVCRSGAQICPHDGYPTHKYRKVARFSCLCAAIVGGKDIEGIDSSVYFVGIGARTIGIRFDY